MALGAFDNPHYVLREIAVKGPSSRSDLAAATGLTPAAISRITRRLLERGILQEGEKVESNGKVGPRFVQLDFSTDAYLIGLGIRAIDQWVELVDFHGRVLKRASLSESNLSDAGALIARCCEEAERIVGESGIRKERIFGVGVAVAGVVDTVTGVVLRAQNLGWERVPVRDLVKARLNLPVHVENLMNSMMLTGNEFKISRERNVLLVMASMGLGASLYLNKHLISGTHYAAGQIGHSRVPGANGLCVCGRRGCLDTVASGRALLRYFDALVASKEIAGSETSTERFLRIAALTQDDLVVAKHLREAGVALGNALGSATTLVDPDLIILTGFVMDSDHYFRGVQEGLDWYAAGTSGQCPEIVRSPKSTLPVPAQLAFNRFVLSRA